MVLNLPNSAEGLSLSPYICAGALEKQKTKGQYEKRQALEAQKGKGEKQKQSDE